MFLTKKFKKNVTNRYAYLLGIIVLKNVKFIYSKSKVQGLVKKVFTF